MKGAIATRELQHLSISTGVSWKWILACGDQPALLLHSSRSSSHWMQRTLEEKLMLNAPRMESSKIWMRCLVSALCSFLRRERKPDVIHACLPRTLENRKAFTFYSLLELRLPALHATVGWHGSCSVLEGQLMLHRLPPPPAVLQLVMGPFVNLHCLSVDPWLCQLLPALHAIFFYKSLVLFSGNLWKLNVCGPERFVKTVGLVPLRKQVFCPL